MSDEVCERRMEELRREAPLRPRGVWSRDGGRFLLCGTLGPEFDAWQRRLATASAADAYFAQRIGLEAVEAEMDRLEAAARQSAAAGETVLPRRSPGYPGWPIELNHEIVARLDATRRIGVAVTDAHLLVPLKSVTAVCEVKA